MADDSIHIANARLRDGTLVDIEIVDGRISGLHTARATATPSHDLQEWLVLPALAEPHAHLDKALTADLVPNPAGDLAGAIDAWTAAAATGVITFDGSVQRCEAALRKLVLSGVTAVRTHVNVGDGFGLEAIRAVRVAAERLEQVIDVQIVALMISPMVGHAGAGNRRALADAIDTGIDLVGGCPHLESNGPAMIEVALDAAADAGLGVDLHVDEVLDASMLTLRDLARAVLNRGFEHRVAASHCVSLGMQGPAVQAEVSALVAEAGIAVIALPQTNLFLQARDIPTAPPRGLTAVDALRDARALVAAGGDNVQDPFNTVGRSDPLETAALMVMAGHQTPDDALAMVSANARQVLGLGEASLGPGDIADFVALDATTARQAIADAPAGRKVFKAGRLVAETSVAATVHS